MPMELLPQFMQTIAKFLPFQYFVSFPIGIILGKLGWVEIIQGIGSQIFWIGLLFWISRLLWAKGYREFEAVGR